MKGESYVVVTQVASYRFGIIVDGVFDTEEIVVKPVAPVLRSIPMFSGNTILGDGSVVMILDPNGLARHTSEMTSSTDLGNQDERREAGEEMRSMLVFYAGDQEAKALPLSLIARLEEFDAERIETVNGQAVVNYRTRSSRCSASTTPCSRRTSPNRPSSSWSRARRSVWRSTGSWTSSRRTSRSA